MQSFAERLKRAREPLLPSSASLTPPPASSVAQIPPEKLREVSDALGWWAIAGIGVAADGPLRLALCAWLPDELKRGQQHSPDPLSAHAIVWAAGKLLAEPVRARMLAEARQRDLIRRGSFLNVDAAGFRDLAYRCAEAVDVTLFNDSDRQSRMLDLSARMFG